MNVPYYTITESSDSKTIGPEYPQMECIDIDIKDGLDTLSLHKGKYIKKVDKIYNLRLPVKGKITDVMSCSLGAGGDFIVSERFFNILRQVNCSSVQFLPITFEHKKSLHSNFYYVHFTYKLEKFIDFERSVYNEYFIEDLNKNKPNNYTEFSRLVNTHKKYNHFQLVKTIFQESFPVEEDLFVLSYANQKKYISTRLCEIIKSKKITGLEIKRTNDIGF